MCFLLSSGTFLKHPANVLFFVIACFRIELHSGRTISFSIMYTLLHSGHTALLSLLLKSSLAAHLHTQPACLAGLPTISAKSDTFLVTTAPAPTKAYIPISCPHTIVAFAPILAPFLRIVFLNSFFLLI